VRVNNIKNKDTAKSDCFCNFYVFFERGGRTSLYFYETVPASKKVGNLCRTIKANKD